MFFYTLWAYKTSVKIASRYTPFHLVHGVKVVLPIKCKIPLSFYLTPLS